MRVINKIVVGIILSAISIGILLLFSSLHVEGDLGQRLIREHDTEQWSATEPSGLAYHDDTFWLTDEDTDKVYELIVGSDGYLDYDDSFDVDLVNPEGIAHDGSDLWTGYYSKIKEHNGETENIKNTYDPDEGHHYSLEWIKGNLWSAGNGDGEFYEYDSSMNIIDTISSPSSTPSGIAYDGTYFWSCDQSTKKVYKHNDDSDLTVIDSFTLKDGGAPYGLTWAYDNLWVVVENKESIWEYTFNEKPNAIIDSDKTEVEVGETVSFDGTDSTDDSSVEEYYFEYGDGDNSGWITQATRSHAYSNEGSYDARLKVKDDDGEESEWSDIITIIVSEANEPPTAIINSDKTDVEEGESVNFDGSDSSDDSAVEQYLFDYGDGENSGWGTQASLSHSYSDEGTYYAKLKVKDDDGEESEWSDTITISVSKPNEIPTAILESDKTDVEEGESIEFDGSGSTDDSAIEQYLFDYGDGENSDWITQEIKSHTFTEEGTYYAKLKVQDDDGEESEWSDTITIQVSKPNDPPTAILESDKTDIEEGDTVEFDGSGSTDDNLVDQYFFDYGDGSDSGWTSQNTKSHTYNNEGTYSAKLKVKDDEGEESEWSDIITIQVTKPNEPPIAVLHSDETEIEEGGSIEFDGTDSSDDNLVAEYFYEYGDGANSGWVAANTKTHTYSNDGTYFAKLKVKDDEGVESEWSDSIEITVHEPNEAPTASLDSDKSEIIEGDSIVFDSSGSTDDVRIDYYFYDFDDGSNSGWTTQDSLSHEYSAEGTYYPRLKVKDNEDEESEWSDAITITVTGSNDPPTAILESDRTEVEPEDSVLFDGSSSTDDGSITHYFYEYGDGTSSGWVTHTSMSHSYSEAGNYDAKLKVRDDEDTESVWSDVLTISVEDPNERPTAILDTDKTSIGEKGSVTFDGTESTDDGNVEYFFFDYGDGDNSGWTSLSTMSHTYSTTGTYYSKLKVRDDDGFESSWSDSITIQVVSSGSPPESIISCDTTTTIVNNTIIFDASESTDNGSIVYYFFDYGDSSDSGWITQDTTSHSYSVTGTYNVRVKTRDDENLESDWSNIITITIIKSDASSLPIAHLEIVMSKDEIGEIIIFNGIKSTGNPGQYYFDFGDGVNSGWVIDNTVQHSYNQVGTYVVFLKVKNSVGESAPTTTTIVIHEKSEDDDSTPGFTVGYTLIGIIVVSGIYFNYQRRS